MNDIDDSRRVQRVHYPYCIEILPLCSDLDLNGHLNHVALIRYCEHARLTVLRTSQQTGPRPLLALVQMDMRFLAEADCRHALAVGTRLDSLGRSSFTVLQAVFGLQDRCLALARAVVVKLDEETRLASPLDDHDLNLLAVLRGAGGS